MKNKSLSLENKFEVIYKELFPSGITAKPNLNKTNIITFAGIPSSGKSTIAKEIQEKYGGIKINLDNVMDIISKKKLAETTEQNEQLKKILVYFILKKPEFKNQLIIVDASLDREYKRFISTCKINKWNYFIIQLELTKQEAISRFKKRNSDNLDNWLPRLDNWVKEHEEFKKNIKPNISLEGTATDLEMLFKELDRLLE